MFYSISSGYPFFMVAFLQIVTFAGIYFKLGDLMAMFSLQSSDTQQVSRRIMRHPYMFLNRRARRLERKIGRTVAAGAAGGVAGAAAATATKKTDNTKAAGSGHTRPNNTPSSHSRGNGKPPALPDKQNSDSSQTVHSSSASQTQETSATSKRGIVDKKAVSKKQSSEKQDKQRPLVDKKSVEQDKERQDNGSATKAGTAKGTAPLHERPVTTPISAKAAPQAAGSKQESTAKERPATVTKEQSQSAREKEPATRKQENVRTQVVRESTSTANKQSAPTTRQTVQRQKQTKTTVQKKTKNKSTVNKSTSRKGGKK